MSNKARILFLLKYLKENTDEERSISASELRRMFRAEGMNVSAPTLRDDIATLIEAGYDIDVEEINGIATWYKYLDRDWSASEVQILIDAVSSSQFITREKSRQLIERLATLAGPSDQDKLEPSIRVEDQVKAPNENILYIVQIIREAIQKDRKIQFEHYQYSTRMERIPKHDGYRYVVSPYAMIWKKDKYYLIGWSEKHDRIAHFRIDRMGMPVITEEPRIPAPETLKLEDRSSKIFSMFDGPEETVKLRCVPELLDQVIDQFGEKIKVTKTAKNYLDILATVHLSPTFYGWLFQYVGQMTIIGPDYVCEQYAERMETGLDDVLGVY